MTDPNFTLEKAVLDRLRASGALVGLVGSAILDKVNQNQAFPYVEIGEGQCVPDAAEGFERSVRATVVLNAYSDDVGKPQVRKICGAIVDALLAGALDIGPAFYPVDMTYQTTRYLIEEDGRTHRGVVSFDALIDIT